MMAIEFWWAAYVLAGVIVVIVVFRLLEWAYTTAEDPAERRQGQLLFSALDAAPVAKALVFITYWLFWPLIALVLAGVLLIGAGGAVLDWIRGSDEEDE